MTLRVAFAFAALLTIAGGPAAVADPTDQSAPAAAATPAPAPCRGPISRCHRASSDPNEVVCKQVEVIGTRLGGGRICKTRAEWADTRRDAHDAVDDAQRNALTSNPKGG